MAPKGREPLRPSLPPGLLKQMGMGDESDRQPGSSRGRQQQTSRKQRRKQERVQKRQRPVAKKSYARVDGAQKPSKLARKSKIAKTSSPASPKRASTVKAEQVAEPGSDGDFDGFSDDASDDSEDDRVTKPVITKATKDRLAKEDAEIAELERKLGIKNRKTLPKSFHEDGLEELLGDMSDGADHEDEDVSAKKKRKAEADEWLAQKRRKATQQTALEDTDDSGGVDELDGLDGASDLESEDGYDDEDLDSEDDDPADSGSNAPEEEKPARVRENPYVAPTISKKDAQKYIPPARRQEAGADAEVLSRIRRQTQGLVNRLTESNLLAILSDIERLYRDHPRQHVTSVLVDILLVQVCEPTSLPDTILILHAGFSTAVYQVIGPDFGAQLTQQIVERFNGYYAGASRSDAQNQPKHTSNLITFLSQMYNFQLLGCNLIFDYVRFLLNDLSELNAELLLRIVRMAGQSLRRDDPLSLKDIVSLIGPAVKKVGETNLSVRTKFMIESIQDLKNNKVKTGAKASAVVQDHTTRMKKLLGSLKTRKATEPLRIGLKDIEDSDKRGRWWVIGASWAGRDDVSEKQSKGGDAGSDKNTADSLVSVKADSWDRLMPDLSHLAAIAREQGMNTDVRREIFIAIMGACDYEHAYMQLSDLHLDRSRQREIAHVVMRCVCCEQQYNPYYALVARRVCRGDDRMKFAFQSGLWKFFRRLGDTPFGDEADEEEEEDDKTIDARQIVAVGKMFGTLVAHEALGLSILKCLNLLHLQPRTRELLLVMFISLFLELPKDNLTKVFREVTHLPALVKGLQYFLKKRVRKADLFDSKKDAKKVKKRCDMAIEALSAPGAEAKVPDVTAVEEGEEEV